MDRQCYERWWTETMEYIRTVPGKVYLDQLTNLTRENIKKYGGDAEVTERGVVDLLNGTGKYLKADVVTGGIYTVPSQRRELDRRLKEANPEYRYNRYLYEPCPPEGLEDGAAAFEELIERPGAVSFDREALEITLDISAPAEREVVTDYFDINLIPRLLLRRFPDLSPMERSKARFGKFTASGVVFTRGACLRWDGDVPFAPVFSKGMCFSEAAFCGPVDVGNLTIDFDSDDGVLDDGYETAKADFRNVRFFAGARFRDVRFTGEARDMEISFEDARVGESLEFINVDFGHTAVNLFQMVLGDFVWYIKRPETPKKDGYTRLLRFVNVDISEESSIDMSDAEIDGAMIIFENVPNIPLTRVLLAPRKYEDAPEKDECPGNFLKFKNCEIDRTLHIGNVSALSFLRTSNYGKVVGASNWGAFTAVTPSGGRKHIIDPLLRAVYNNSTPDEPDSPNAVNELNYSKAKDFVMLKENFNAAGKYDEEDEAFILYMHYKPYIDSVQHPAGGKALPREYPWTKYMYRLLEVVGRYGISPVRVVVSLALEVLFFTLGYWLVAMSLGAGAFSTGETVLSALRAGGAAANILPSFIFSLSNVVPFVSQFEPIHWSVTVLSVLENAIGSFLVGYFSVAVVRKTLR